MNKYYFFSSTDTCVRFVNKSPRAQRRSPGYDVQRFKKIFKKLPIAEADKPQGGAIVTRGHNFNNLGKGTLGDTTYQISKCSQVENMV